MWRNGAFAGEFGDAYIADTELEGGQVAPSIKTLLQVIRDSVISKRALELTAFDPEVDFPKIERICADLESAAERVSSAGWGALRGHTEAKASAPTDHVRDESYALAQSLCACTLLPFYVALCQPASFIDSFCFITLTQLFRAGRYDHEHWSSAASRKRAE